MTTNIESMVMELASREEIKELRYRYCRALDAKDFDDVEVCFVEDAVVDFGPAGRYESRAALMAMLNQFAAANPMIGIHVLTNPIIDFVSDTSATAQWVSTFSGHDPEKGGLTKQTGLCFDEYVKTQDGWRIKGCTYQILFHEMQSSGAGSPLF